MALGILILSIGLMMVVNPFLPEVPEEPEVEAAATTTSTAVDSTATVLSQTSTSTSTDRPASASTTVAGPSTTEEQVTSTPSDPFCVQVGNSMPVDASCFEEEWPLTVDSGTLTCENDAVTFESGGVVYADNGLAMTWDLGEDIDPIWKDHPDLDSLKVNIGPLLDTGLDVLCA